jgi:hypothetical protein
LAQVFPPQVVEGLQQDFLFHLAHDVRGHTFATFCGIAASAGAQAVADLFFGDAFLGGPVLDRQIEVQDLRTSSCRPSVSHCSG